MRLFLNMLKNITALTHEDAVTFMSANNCLRQQNSILFDDN